MKYSITLLTLLPCLSYGGEVTTLDEVLVVDHNSAVLYPTRMAQEKIIREQPGGGSLITDKPIISARPEDALSQQAGVVVQSFSGGNDQTRLSVRGSGIQSFPPTRGLALFQNGFPINDADGSFNLGLVNFSNTQFISVLRGANALRSATSSLGGEIELFSNQGRQNNQVSYQLGSFGRQNTFATVGAENSDGDINLSANLDDYDGYRTQSSSYRKGLSLNSTYFLSDHLSNSLYVDLAKLRFNIPGPLSKDQLEEDPTQANPMYAKAKPFRHLENIRIGDRLSFAQGQQRYDLQLWYSHTFDDFKTPMSRYISHINTYGSSLSADIKLNDQHHLTSYLSFDQSDIDRSFYAKNNASMGIYNLTANNLRFNVRDYYQIDRDFSVIAGTDFALSRRNGESKHQNLDQLYRTFAPKIGALYQWNAANTLFANVSYSAEVPTFWDIQDTKGQNVILKPLDQQKATTYEIGARGSLLDSWYYDLAIYHAIVDNEIVLTYDDSGTQMGAFNYQGTSWHQGVELALNKTQYLGSTELDYNLTWTFNRYTFQSGLYQGKHLPTIPDHIITAQIKAKHGKFGAGADMNYVPTSTPVDYVNSGRQELDPYLIVNVGVDYQPITDLTLWAKVDNILDENYAAMSVARDKVGSSKQPTQFPGLGRSVNIGFQYKY
ncbi:TPA: TonB-dependent receptor family protein [Photobacterium damselae]